MTAPSEVHSYVASLVEKVFACKLQRRYCMLCLVIQ